MGLRGKRRYVGKEVAVDGKIIPLKQVKKIGGSWYLPLPKIWLDWFCKENSKGEYWVEISVDADIITIKGYEERVEG